MSISSAAILALASQCAPNVAPQTVAAIVKTESHGDPLALNVNGPRQPASASTIVDAVAIAKRYVAAGYSVDLGLAQINSRNMRRLRLTWENVFDPCTNITALGQILTQNYEAVAGGRHPQSALRLALSLYNTGSTSRGFRNGYVAKVVVNARAAVAALRAASNPARGQDDDLRGAVVAENMPFAKVEGPPPTLPPAWNVFERAAYERSVNNINETQEGAIRWTN